MEEIINVKLIDNSISMIDYLPYMISIISILVSFGIVFIQYRQTIKMQEKSAIYNTKKEVLFETLYFLDTYISWLTPGSGYVPIRKNISVSDMTEEGRRCYNKLCLYCENIKLLNLFWKIINPDSDGKPYSVYDLYNKFRMECRNELGISKKELPIENIFLSCVATTDMFKEENANSTKNHKN